MWYDLYITSNQQEVAMDEKLRQKIFDSRRFARINGSKVMQDVLRGLDEGNREDRFRGAGLTPEQDRDDRLRQPLPPKK